MINNNNNIIIQPCAITIYLVHTYVCRVVMMCYDILLGITADVVMMCYDILLGITADVGLRNISVDCRLKDPENIRQTNISS